MPRVLGIFTSNGGVPKHPVSSADVDKLGLVSDKQNNRKHHGGVNKAVCVLDNNLLVKLRNEGHPIYPGSTGENLLLEGFDLNIGKVIDLGDVILEVVSAATPCYKIADSFTDGYFDRMSDKKYPKDTRWYCKVLQPGKIRISD